MVGNEYPLPNRVFASGVASIPLFGFIIDLLFPFSSAKDFQQDRPHFQFLAANRLRIPLLNISGIEYLGTDDRIWNRFLTLHIPDNEYKTRLSPYQFLQDVEFGQL